MKMIKKHKRENKNTIFFLSTISQPNCYRNSDVTANSSEQNDNEVSLPWFILTSYIDLTADILKYHKKTDGNFWFSPNMKAV